MYRIAYGGQNVVLVDTPGFDRVETLSGEIKPVSDVDTMACVANAISMSVRLCFGSMKGCLIDFVGIATTGRRCCSISRTCVWPRTSH